MLTCIYHPIDPCRVVESDVADKLKESGVWFDCPKKAEKYRLNVERECQEEEVKPKSAPRGAKK